MADEEESRSTGELCAVCNKPGNKRCSCCRSVNYCGVECQKKHWKKHKKRCFAPNSTCTRCLESFDPRKHSVCRVPHPEYLLEDQGSMFGPSGTSLNMFCGACSNVFSKSAPGLVTTDSNPEWTYEPTNCRWCYEGPHTTNPIPPGDDRRIRNDIASIIATTDIQEKIDAIPSGVRILSIKSAGGCFDDSLNPVLNRPLPNLEKLQLIDVAFSEVKLNSELTPKLEDLEMQNIPDECDIQVVCPALKFFDMRYFHGPDQWVDVMLRAATKLEKFQSYKLGVSTISFQSNELREIHLHRSDILGSVTIWAPRLEYLRLQGCYSLEDIEILDDHPLAKYLPPNFDKTDFDVDTTNSCLSPRCSYVLETHPRVAWEGSEEDETAGVGGSGIESMFMRMHQFGGRF